MAWQYGERIWNSLLPVIKNEYGVAALMGNLHAESGLMPNNLQNSYETSLGFTDESYTEAVDNGTYTVEQFVNDGAGYGLAQWTFSSRKQALYDLKILYARSIGDVDLQVEMILRELMFDYPEVYAALQNATSIRQASDIVLTEFEKPADQSEAVKELRESYGLTVYNTYSSSGTPDPDIPIIPDIPPIIPSLFKKRKKFKFVLFNQRRRKERFK